jgi:hypothetical protein
MRQNCLKHTFAILEHLVVPKTKNFPTLALQVRVADDISKALRVLRAVSLDDQLSPNAKKVDDVGSQWDLPAKLDPVQATIAQETPQAKLDVSRRSAHRSGAGTLVRRDAFVSLHRSSLSGPSSVAPSARHLLPGGEGKSCAIVGPALLPGGEGKSCAIVGPPLLPQGEGGA